MYIVYTTDSVAYKGEKVKMSLVESISKVYFISKNKNFGKRRKVPGKKQDITKQNG